MKRQLVLMTAVCSAVLLSGCAYDDDDYGVRSVSVSTGGPAYYGDYDEYTPYYSYSGRRYYRSANRYVYYQDRRPYYVTSLPRRAVYVTPPARRTTTRVVRHRYYDRD